MITDTMALAIADKAADDAGWGRIDNDDYVAVRGTMDGTEVWHIRRKIMMIGHALTFAVSCEDGTILHRHMRGPR